MEVLMLIINSLIVYLFSNYYIYDAIYKINLSFIFLIICFLIINIFPSLFLKRLETKKLSKIRNGYRLLEVFVLSLIFSISMLLVNIFVYHINFKAILFNVIFITISEFIIFWNGMFRVYVSSYQLGFRYRISGFLLGIIPIVNIIMLFKIIKVCRDEVEFENNKTILNKKRKDDEICKTKYPILFVHGVFFRDSEFVNYWGRVPDELKRNGAVIYYGKHSSALSVSDSAKELVARIEEIVEDSGCEKVNIIAHSKGGLDSRYAISVLGASKYVASLTTINTPHKGCEFADYLIEHTSKEFKNNLAKTYNSTMKKLGEKNPDFLSAVNDLTSSNVKELNKKMNMVDGVYYKSVGSVLSKATSGRFPLNLTFNFVKLFDGKNDGLVGINSFKYGDDFTLLDINSNRGISHADVIDLNRENIPGFDVREFYVNIVKELKEKGF